MLSFLYSIARFLAVITDPNRLMRSMIHRSANVPLSEKVLYDASIRPSYAYSTYYAARQARALGLKAISAIEFGVAGGNGLVALEQIAGEAQTETGVTVKVYGFDTGAGMPGAADFRDEPYIYEKGSYRMDEQQLRRRLSRAKLVLGDVSQTVSGFLAQENPPPIGFISFDLDYYTSTVAAFKLLDGPDKYFLPRVYCYFDDIIGDEFELHGEYTGELLAIREFNDQHPRMKLSKIHGLGYKRRIRMDWNDTIYVLHRFDHPDYNRHVHPTKSAQLPLTGD